MPYSNDLPDYDTAAIVEAIKKANSVFITAHVGPDGDTLGTMLGLKWALAELPSGGQQRVDCVIAGKMPDIYQFMPGIDEVINVETADNLLDTYDLAVSVDCGSIARLGPARPYFENAKQSLNLDHHVSNEHFGQLNLVVTTAGASGEVLGLLLPYLGVSFTKNIAICIYVAILTDTGGFRFSSTSARIFEMCADLVKAGVEPEPVYKAVYESMPREQALLHAEAVTHSEHGLANQLVWGEVTRAMMAKFDAIDEHIEGLIDRYREMKGVKVAALFRETDKGDIKISLRSNDERINVAEILQNTFDGGGHKMAAGANFAGSLQEAKAILLPLLEQSIQRLAEPVSC